MYLCVVLKIKKQKLKTKLHIDGGETQCVVPSGGKWETWLKRDTVDWMLLWFKDSEFDKLQSQTEQQTFGLN